MSSSCYKDLYRLIWYCYAIKLTGYTCNQVNVRDMSLS